jgi:hypothetical protein
MSFLGSLFFLASLISGVMVPIYFGRGLAEGDTTRMLMSLGFVALTAIFVLLYSRVDRGRGET